MKVTDKMLDEYKLLTEYLERVVDLCNWLYSHNGLVDSTLDGLYEEISNKWVELGLIIDEDEEDPSEKYEQYGDFWK